jgi:hypothetical protein
MRRRSLSRRFEAGIALGPILFLLAVIGIIGLVLSAGSSGFTTAAVSDRVKADMVSQINLIRAKINECITIYGSFTDYTTYPQALTATPVSNITCPGDSGNNLWTGSHPANMPPPTAGFGPWYYINTNGTGGTNKGACIWTQPTTPSGAIGDGLKAASAKFTTSTVNLGTSEMNYNSALSNQRIVVWISTPPATADTNCTPQ